MHRMSLLAIRVLTGAAASLAAWTAAGDTPSFHWVRGGHGGVVQGVTVSPDGQLVASAGGDGTVKLWRVSDGRLRRTLVAYDNQVFGFHGAIFSPDGTLIIGAGVGGATVWRASDGAPVRSLPGFETAYGMAFSPDEQLIAVTGSIDGLEEATRIFRAGDGQLVRTIIGPNNFYGLSVVFARDGQSIFVARGSLFFGGPPGAITQYDVASGGIVRTLVGHARRVGTISLSPDGATLASGSEDASIRFWNASDGASIGIIPNAHTGEANQVRFSPDGLTLVSAGFDGLLHIWRVSDRALIGSLTGHSGSVSSAAWTGDGSRILSAGGQPLGGGGDGSVRLWDVATGALLRRFTDFTSRSPLLSVTPDGQLATANAANPIQIRRVTDGALLHTISTAGLYTRTIALSPGGDRLAISLMNVPVQLRLVASGAVYATIPVAPNTPVTLAFSPDGQYVVVGTYDAGLQLYRADDGSLVRSMVSAAHVANRPSFTADGSLLVASGGSLAMVWRVADGTVVQTFATPQYGAQVAAISSDGTLVATGGSEPSLRIWRVSDGALVRSITTSQWSVGCAAFSPDSQFLLTGSQYYSHTLRVWRVSDGVGVGTIDNQNGTGVDSAHFSNDGRSVLLSRLDGVVGAVRNPALPACPPDVDGDGVMDLADLAVQLSHFGGSEDEYPATGDLDDDGDVDLSDLATLLSAFGSTCP